MLAVNRGNVMLSTFHHGPVLLFSMKVHALAATRTCLLSVLIATLPPLPEVQNAKNVA